MTRFLTLFPGILALTLAAASPAVAQETGAAPTPGAWSDEVVELFATLPVQDGGRIKPMDSFAGLHLLTHNGKRTLKLADGTELGPNRWLLDVVFRPELARTYPSFRIQTDAVLTVMGLEAKEKRDWYSYDELVPGRAALEREVAEAIEVEQAERDALERQVIKLAQDLRDFDSLASLLATARQDYPTEDPALVAILGPHQQGSAWILPHAAALQRLASSRAPEDAAAVDAARSLFAALDEVLSQGFRAVSLIPPPATEEGELDETWWRPTDVLVGAFTTAREIDAQLALYELLEQLDREKDDPAAFLGTLREFHSRVVGMAEARDEYGQIPLEVKLYEWQLFPRSLVSFLAAFLVACAGMLLPGRRWLQWGSLGLTGLGLALVTAGIVLRCIIRERPPVVSLYDTILFITAVTVIAALFIEWATRQRIGLYLAAFLGLAGMFLAGRYELKEVATAGDTMASVVAVLDTNYYLAIHVTTVTMGYAGGLLAAALAHLWIFGKLFGVRRGDKDFYKGITRMTYGTVCFSLLFSLFGTIMGGVWANDSWGRFWGWDPKENGALLIVIWMLIILHARLGGYIRERGMANLAVLGGVVVSASWWGVNLLNVGLHSYGFTSGVALALYIYWGTAGLVLAASGFHWLAEREAAAGDGGGGSGEPPAPSPA